MTKREKILGLQADVAMLKHCCSKYIGSTDLIARTNSIEMKIVRLLEEEESQSNLPDSNLPGVVLERGGGIAIPSTRLSIGGLRLERRIVLREGDEFGVYDRGMLLNKVPAKECTSVGTFSLDHPSVAFKTQKDCGENSYIKLFSSPNYGAYTACILGTVRDAVLGEDWTERQILHSPDCKGWTKSESEVWLLINNVYLEPPPEWKLPPP